MFKLPPAKIRNGFISTRKVINSNIEYITNAEGEIFDEYYFATTGSELTQTYSFFKFVLNSDGTLWDDANLFLFDKVKMNPNFSPSSMTNYNVWLTHFKKFVDDYNIEYKDSADWGFEDTAVHKYRHNLVNIGKSPSQSKKAMLVITAFYEWLQQEDNFISIYPMWKSRIVTNRHGRTVVSKDVCQFSHLKAISGTTKEYVEDGERLRPLHYDEVETIIDVLNDYGNPEYKLIFYLALETFARKQTILTLRLWHILEAVPNNKITNLPKSSDKKDVNAWLEKIKWPNDNDELSIQVGEGYDADSKKGKYTSYPIYIHGWLWKLLITYIVSKRAFNRRNKAPLQRTTLHQYLFLSQNGNALYHAKNDLHYNKLSEISLTHLAKGNTLDKFIDRTLKNKIDDKGKRIMFYFHCLRATGAALFLKAKRKENGPYKNISKWENDLEELSNRLNHTYTDTTKGYLIYLIRNENLPKVQEQYENKLFKIVKKYENINKDFV